MISDLTGGETCAICGRDLNDGRVFCHFYSSGSRVSLCSPKCAESYQHRDDGTENGPRYAIQQKLADLRWR